LSFLAGKDGRVALYAYIKYMLLSLGSVDRDELRAIEDRFDRLDVDGEGVVEPIAFTTAGRRKSRQKKKRREPSVIL